MIAFASAITKPEVYRRCAEPGIRRAAEPDSEIYELASIGSIFRSYNAVLDEFAGREDLEALVLVHQDAEIIEPDFCRIAREALRDPEVGLVGCVGAIGVRSIAWWEGSVACASFSHRYEEHGGGEWLAFSWVWEDAPPYARTGEVDTLDGFLMVLSPWTVRNIRFDESLGDLHGYDFDLCVQVRAAGRKVVTADFRAVHHHPLVPFSDPDTWISAHMQVAEKWDGRFDGVGSGVGSWRDRALRAEAERDVARLVDHTNLVKTEVRARELQRILDEATSSIGWRATAPLRNSRWRRARRERARLARTEQGPAR